MRVCIVSRIYRPEPSAASLFLGSVADALTASGHAVEVVTVQADKALGSGSRGERIRTFPVLRDSSGYVRGILQYLSFDIPLFFRLLFMKRPDVVFVEPPPTTGAVVRIVCAIRRIPYVYDAADIWSDAAQLEPVSNIIVRGLKMVEGFALRGATQIVTISHGVEQRIREFRGKQPIAVTGFGASIEDFHYVPAETLKEFVYAGSYAPAHGAEILVSAFADFLKSHPGYTLKFIGNGVERTRVEDCASEHGITHSIEYLDPVPPAELLPYLSSALASLATIKPGTVYEYSYASKAFSSLAAGCPVLFAGPGPTVNLIESISEHVPAGRACAYRVDEIAQAMRIIADNPAGPDSRENLSKFTASEYSMKSVANRVVTVLQQAGKAHETRI